MALSRMHVLRIAPVAALSLLVSVGARPALAALDLTGTWEGTWSCKDVTSGAPTKPKSTLTMTVTQSGSDVHAVLAWDGVNSFDAFQGHVQELTGKPGQGAATIISCGTRAGSSEYAETLSVNVKVSPTNAKPANATFKGTSTYEQAPGIVGGVCKYSLKRVSLADPGVASCPVPSVCGNGTIEAPETCDIGNLNGKTCQTQGFAGGTLGCATGCTLDTSGCWATRWVDNGDGTATDNTTGLQWELKTDFADEHWQYEAYTWCYADLGECVEAGSPPGGTAFTGLLGTLNGGSSVNGVTTTGCFAGHCDWRLPTIGELRSILDAQYPNCASDPCTSIPGPTLSSLYWSSSLGVTGTAWAIDFSNGLVTPLTKSFYNNARAVRGGS